MTAATGRVSVRFRCACPGAPLLDLAASSPQALPRTSSCAACGAHRDLFADRVSPSGGLLGCLVCGHAELYTRKVFPAALGLSVVIAAAVLAPITHYLSLVAAAAVDLVMYRRLPNAVVCYVCSAEHRGFSSDPRHPRFDREIEERLRYGERAVMGRPMRTGGTAGAPEPEH